jgi:hypothetical protein
MNLYLISQTVNVGYDTYDSAVVAAEDFVAASLTHPGPWFFECVDMPSRWIIYQWDGKRWEDQDHQEAYDDWATPADVKVEFIGTARADLQSGVICASFNAG